MLRTTGILSTAFLLVCSAGLHGQTVPATPLAPRRGPDVALVDVVKVFENHTRFKQQMEAIRQEIQAFERELMQQQEAIGRQNEHLAAATSDVQRNQMEASIARQLADVQVKASLKRNEILAREAQVYYETYDEVVREVARLANTHNISLVLRYDSSPINPQDRGSVLKGVNNPIVVQHKLDLTDALIAQVRVSGGQSPLGANTAGPQLPVERSLSTRIPFSNAYPN